MRKNLRKTYISLNINMNKQDLAKKIKDLLIIKQDDNSYHLFGQYVITRDNNQIYTISHIYDSDISNLNFAELKYAVTWCVFHKNKKLKELPKIADLDEQLSGLQVSIEQLKKLSVKGDKDNRPIYLAKLSERKLKRQQALKLMNDYIDTSKSWQTRLFKEYQTL